MDMVQQSPTEPDFVQDPYPFYAGLRRRGDFVHWDDFGIPMAIADGRDPATIDSLLAGEERGTFFFPRRRKMAGRKHWILHSISPQGKLSVDAGAARAVSQKGKSLLPAGITAVQGGFSAGDAVRIIGPGGIEVARGLVNYSADDIVRIKGLRTDQVRLVLGYSYEEVIHRDDLVLVEKER